MMHFHIDALQEGGKKISFKYLISLNHCNLEYYFLTRKLSKMKTIM